MEILTKALEDEALLLDLEAENLESVFHSVLDLIVERGWLPSEHRGRVEDALEERERQVSTAIGHAVAVPHTYLDVFDDQVVVFVRLKKPLDLKAPDGYRVRFLYVLLGPPGSATQHLDTLTTIARLMSDEEFRYDAADAQNSRQLLAALDRFNARAAGPTIPGEEEIPEGLRYTGRPFGGLIADLRRRMPHYISDIKDGLHPKCLSSTLFLFFACLAPAVTFGGVMAEVTEGAIGPVEMILVTAVCGIVYALTAGQPLTILAGTGPMLIFTAILYRLCAQFELAFFPVYAWVGLWTGGFLILLAVTDASCLMRFFTRFTDEIFASLISLIFIFTAIGKLAETFEVLEYDHHHATAVLTLLLALGTLYIANSLARFRRSRYLVQAVREFLADFGPTIALAAMTGVAIWLRDVELTQLPAPDSLEPTLRVNPDTGEPLPTTADPEQGVPRPWLLSLGGVPGWVPFAAAFPAMLVTMLVFINQNITTRLVNSPDHKIQKGDAYHLGLGLVGVLIAIPSLFGLPWLVASIVPSLNHVRSLATTEDVEVPGGGTRERIIHTRENRLTGLGIHLLMATSLFFLPLLSQIPMAVLYGLFLYMGLVSLSGNQFFERLSLWAMDRNHYPSTHYIRKVPNKTIHKFTLLQLACLGVLALLNASPPVISILFPLFVALLVPLRIFATRFFVPEHLAALDAAEEPQEEQLHWSV